MTIEDVNTLDMMGIDPTTGAVELGISDHLDWTDQNEHLLMLERKVNTYLWFVESDQLLDRLPEASGRQVRIVVIQQFAAPDSAKPFLDDLHRQLAKLNIDFAYNTLPSG